MNLRLFSLFSSALALSVRIAMFMSVLKLRTGASEERWMVAPGCDE
jgi:hypothetical protein